MGAELLDLYGRASGWMVSLVGNATNLEAATPCDQWTVRQLLNHTLDTQHYFLAAAQGRDASPPGPNPPEIIGDRPQQDFERVRAQMLETFGAPEMVEKTGPMLGIAFADQLLHSWDLARATGQDDTMPDGLPQAAYEVIHGRFTEEQRAGVFKPELPVDDDATPQQRLLAYTGRPPK